MLAWIETSKHSAIGGIPVQFPGTLAPGSHYYLALKTAECLVGNYDRGNQFTMLKNAPNPFGNQTIISAESLVAGDFQFEVFDLLGQVSRLEELMPHNWRPATESLKK